MLPGNAALNQRIEDVVTVTYYGFLQVDSVSRPRPTDMEVLSFTVEETLTAARIEIFMLTDDLVKDSIYVVYVDKANNTEITAAAFAESAELEEAAEEAAVEEDETIQGEVEVVEVFMSPVRINAEAAGFTVIWHYDGAVLVYDEGLELNILTGSTLATLVEGEEETTITLDAAPVNNGGIVYVPSTLLTDVLGIQFTLLTSADYVAAAPAAEEVEEYEEHDEYMVFETIVGHDVAELTFEQFVAELEADLLAELYEDESLEVIIGEGYELTLIISSDDAFLVEDVEDFGLEFAEEIRDELGLESFTLTIRIIGLDGTVLFDETFEV